MFGALELKHMLLGVPLGQARTHNMIDASICTHFVCDALVVYLQLYNAL